MGARCLDGDASWKARVMNQAHLLLRSLASWPFLRVERRGARAFLYGDVTDQLFGTLDLSTGSLAVDRGVRLDLIDAASRVAAEALIRRRIDIECFMPQMRVASP